jgi:2-(1,2-epoxy-1,2-dihydrophenyl)acetyl-CoA isomerase
MIKKALAVGSGGTLNDALEIEASTQAMAGATDDHREAVAAFVAKRKPKFTGK